MMPFSSMVSHPKLSAILGNDKKVYRLFDIALPQSVEYVLQMTYLDPYSHIIYKLSIIITGPNRLLYQTSSREFCARRLVEIFYQTSSSRKIATYQASFRRSKYLLDIQQQKNSSTRHLVEFLLDAQQSFYQTSNRPDDVGHLDGSPAFLTV